MVPCVVVNRHRHPLRAGATTEIEQPALESAEYPIPAIVRIVLTGDQSIVVASFDPRFYGQGVAENERVGERRRCPVALEALSE